MTTASFAAAWNIDEAAPPPDATAIDFNETVTSDNYLRLTSPTATDTKEITLSTWIGGENSLARFITMSTKYMYIDSSGRITVELGNSSGTRILYFKTPSSSFAFDNTLYHFFFTVDLTNSANRKVYLDGVDITSSCTWTDYTNDNIDFTNSTFFGGINGEWTGCMGETWLDNSYIASVDITKFYNGGEAVYAGDTGELPTGSQPLYYLLMNASDPSANLGSAGTPSINGSPTTACASPPVRYGGGGGEPPPAPTLDLPAAEAGATVLSLHDTWVAGDITVTNASVNLTNPGEGNAGNIFASGDLRLPSNPDGKYEIVTDDLTGDLCLELTHSDSYTIDSHHTEIEPINNGSRIFYLPGDRFVIDFYRRDLYITADEDFEIIWQLHGIRDGTSDTATNPPITVDMGDTSKGHTTWVGGIRAEQDLVKPPGIYDRDDTIIFTLLPHSGMDTGWHYYRIEFEPDYTPSGGNGYLKSTRDTTTIYEESGTQICYNDAKGNVIQMGYYKYFGAGTVSLRVCRFGPIRVQRLA